MFLDTVSRINSALLGCFAVMIRAASSFLTAVLFLLYTLYMKRMKVRTFSEDRYPTYPLQ